jgi:hypothetical protein
MLSRDAMLLALTCVAGLVDALSYLELGHVFTAMMTGNTVLLAMAIGQGEVPAALGSTEAAHLSPLPDGVSLPDHRLCLGHDGARRHHREEREQHR